ncbi:MAG: RnfABCDGE type electron transport complex subunit D [Clostridia bacterium]|nr:RnfABCDGE type electron transport complex subunit D [Clostridia bacterium]
MSRKLVVSSSPFLRNTSVTTRGIMLDVIIAMLPTAFAAVWYFGKGALTLMLTAVICCVAAEWLYQKLTHQKSTISDLSAVVTGMLLAFNMPADAPWWMAAVGSVIAIVLVKQIFGGLGHNFVNPALAARTILMMSWTVLMTAQVLPAAGEFFGLTAAAMDATSAATQAVATAAPAIDAVASATVQAVSSASGAVDAVAAATQAVATAAPAIDAVASATVQAVSSASGAVDAVASATVQAVSSASTSVDAVASATVDAVSVATPLAPNASGYTLWQLFSGNIPGMLGETCKLTLLLGGIYLIIRRVIDWRIPVSFIGTAFLLFLAKYGVVYSVESGANNALYQLLSGGLILGAFFMATDYVTSPITKWGRVIMGVGCALILFLIRNAGTYPEGCSFAILFMNVLTPMIDKFTTRKPFGTVKPAKGGAQA